MSKQPTDPKDVAASTVMGVAAKAGSARIKAQRTGGAQTAGLAAARPGRASARSTVPLLVFMAVLFGMLAVMLKFG